jgi:hypothetical protein
MRSISSCSTCRLTVYFVTYTFFRVLLSSFKRTYFSSYNACSTYRDLIAQWRKLLRAIRLNLLEPPPAVAVCQPNTRCPS